MEDTCCHPCRDPGSASSKLPRPGCGGWSPVKSLQTGARKPTSSNRSRDSTADSRCLPGSRFVNAATNCSATAGCLLAVVCTQSAQLDQYAALLTLGADRKPNPPNDNGRFATSHDSGEMSAPKIRVRHSFKEAVWFTAYSSVCAGEWLSRGNLPWCRHNREATAKQLADPGQKGSAPATACEKH